MSDKRYFAKVDVGYLDNPKVADLLDGDKGAILLHLRAILYCCQHLTDGVFPIAQVARLAAATACDSVCDPQSESQCDLCKCVQNGLLMRLNGRLGEVHDYLEHQESAQKAAQRSAAGQKGAAARWATGRNANRIPNGSADRNADEMRGEEMRGEEKYTRARGACSPTPAPLDADTDFEAFWSTYPRRAGKPKARIAYAKARQRADAAAILNGVRAHLPAWGAGEAKFIPHPTTWLNRDGWDDDPPPPPDHRSQRQREQDALIASWEAKSAQEREQQDRLELGA